MDDFGSGYSSLNSLSMLPFEVIKIDKSLIDKIGDQKGELILKHTLNIIRELGMKLVAEGVETSEQIQKLKQFQIDAIQGFYYSKPVCKADFSEMIRKHFEDSEEDLHDIV